MDETSINNFPLKKSLILVRGLGGTGKTTLSTSLSQALRIPVFNRDDVKKAIQSFNFDLSTQSDIGYQVMNSLAHVQLRNGISAILDANARFHSMQSYYEKMHVGSSFNPSCFELAEGNEHFSRVVRKALRLLI